LLRAALHRSGQSGGVTGPAWAAYEHEHLARFGHPRMQASRALVAKLQLGHENG